jgi:hypothetical protein
VRSAISIAPFALAFVYRARIYRLPLSVVFIAAVMSFIAYGVSARPDDRRPYHPGHPVAKDRPVLKMAGCRQHGGDNIVATTRWRRRREWRLWRPPPKVLLVVHPPFASWWEAGRPVPQGL